ncbi:MAG: hypothetical protein KDB80_01615 [Planctomycetes bacterium]|nr:hypothetical protein [Planctomycetota bacterium]
MKTFTQLLVVAALAAPAFAQTQLVRGDVNGIQGTNLFQLDCTNIQLTSSTLNLQALHDATRQTNNDYDLQVVQVGSNPVVLDVVSATLVPELFQMGNLRFGRSETWEVFGPAGSPTAVFIALRSTTGYAPIGAQGTWLLGPSYGRLMFGVIGPLGRFEFQFQMPALPALVGTEITSQAIIAPPGQPAYVTNPDCKEVRAN